MKRGMSKTLFVMLVYGALGFLASILAFAASDCSVGGAGIWHGDYRIDTPDDLKALSGYTSVTGSLFITDSSLSSLEGLECLIHVGGSLLIDGNRSLTSLTGLGRLKSVGSNLYFIVNDSLTSLAGLERLESIGGSLGVTSNLSLTSLTGLERLKSVGGTVQIEINRSLTSLAGLERLESIGGGLNITLNSNLCTSLAKALRDQVLGAGGIGGLIGIFGNQDC
jgi:hypothetical protein